MKLIYSRLIKKYQGEFRILEDWEINYEDDGKYYDQCSFNNKTKKAAIYPFSPGKERLDQYVFHEMLHICQCALRRGSTKERGEKEELLIQDLCKIYDEFYNTK